MFLNHNKKVWTLTLVLVCDHSFNYNLHDDTFGRGYSENISSSAFVDISFNPSVTTKHFQQYIIPLDQKLKPLTDSIKSN